jgi:hypothetical protein
LCRSCAQAPREVIGVAADIFLKAALAILKIRLLKRLAVERGREALKRHVDRVLLVLEVHGGHCKL